MQRVSLLFPPADLISQHCSILVQQRHAVFRFDTHAHCHGASRLRTRSTAQSKASICPIPVSIAETGLLYNSSCSHTDYQCLTGVGFR